MLAWWREQQFNKAQKRVSELADMQKGLISDGYHSFNDLYEARNTLYIALCREIVNSSKTQLWNKKSPVWRSIKHSDGKIWKDWFILGIGKEWGHQMTFHLPLSMWVDTSFAETLDKAPDYDQHSTEIVLERINNL